jgi:hypothetical protein
MPKKALLAVAAFVVFGAASSASADVQLSMRDGRVTIIARDATVRQILTEWARVGQTKIVNVERIPGAPLTIELRDVPEQQALKILLRSISGYVTAPRATMVAADASVFDRIIVMPTVATTAAPLSAAPPPPPAFATFQRPQEPPALDSDDERPNPSAPTPPPGSRGPVFFSFPPAQGTTTQAPPAGRANTPQAESAPFVPAQQPGTVPTLPPAVSYPGAPTTSVPAGVATPGMVAPVPAPQPGQQQPPPQP